MCQKCCIIFVCASLQCICCMTKAVQPVVVLHCVDSIVIVGVLTRYALLHFMCDFKAAQMNIRHSLIRELMLYNFELGHNTTETTKNICCVKGKSTIDHSTVTRWFKRFCSESKSLNNLAKTGKPKIVDLEATFQVIDANQVSSTWRVSGELGISHFNLVHLLPELGKNIRSCRIVPHVTQISLNFLLTLHTYICIYVCKVCWIWGSRNVL